MLLTAGVVASLAVGSFESLRKRARRENCYSNLRSLYYASSSYLADQNHWPQVSSRLIHQKPGEYTQRWKEALSPYGIQIQHLTCPTAAAVRRKLPKEGDSPDADKPNYVDYVATPFGKDPLAPYRYLTQPWFAETTGSHGKANLLIHGNGEVKELSELINSISRSVGR